MHEDGRVEDMDPVAMGMPPGWAPPGFESSAPPPAPVEMAPEPQAQIPEQPAPAPSAPTSSPTQTRSSQSVSGSWRGATVGVDGSPGASNRLDRRAAADANRFMAAQEPAAAMGREAVNATVAAQTAGSDAQARGFADEATLLRDQQEARAQELAVVQEKSTRWTTEIRDAMNAVPTMDPNKLFADASDAQTVGMAMSAFMGGFLQPVLGTNTPMDIITKAVDRSVQQQLNAQEMAQRKVWNLKDLAARDEQAALFELNQADIGRAAHLTALQRDVQAKVQGYQSDVFKAQGMKLLADIDKGLADTWQNIFMSSRSFLESQRHNMRTESIQSQQLALREAEMKAEAEARKAAAAAKQSANFLHGDTGIRASGPNAVAGGWVAPNEKIREEAARKFEGGKDQWTAAEKLKRLSSGGHFGAPGSEQRARAAAAATRMSFDLMSRLTGLGQKEDTERMMQAFGGNPDKFFRFESEETIKKVLADYQDTVGSNMKTYADSLKYHPDDKIEWSAPEIPADAPEVGTMFGDSLLEMEAAVQGKPSASYEGSVKGMLAELETYPDGPKDPEARAKLDRAISVLEQVPPEQRVVQFNPGGADEATKAQHSGREGLDRPLFGDSPVDPLLILKKYRDEGASAQASDEAKAAAEAAEKARVQKNLSEIQGSARFRRPE